MPTDMWVVPGAPLLDGAGWRIWYSRLGTDDREPDPVTVELAGQEQATSTAWDRLPVVQHVGRRAGVLTLTLDQPHPGARYDVAIPEAGRFSWRTLPASLDGGVNFLVSSCFYRNGDKQGRYGATVAELAKKVKPAFKLLIGDQVYTDWPYARSVLTGLAKFYAERYAEYWGDTGYQKALQACPTMFTPDDHEFWNSYPERQFHPPWAFRRGWRDTSTRAAQALYDHYQGSANPSGQRYFDFVVGRVGFFVSDSRSQRTVAGNAASHFFPAAEWVDLETWFHGLTGPGVLVLAQPLYQARGGGSDRSLADFGPDQAQLRSLLEGALRGNTGDGRPHDVLIVAGDIHKGRHSVGEIAGMPGAEVHEFVASPASLVMKAPFLGSDGKPPGKLQPPGQPLWTVRLVGGGPLSSNHVGAVRMSEGTNGRVRFELELWSVKQARGVPSPREGEIRPVHSWEIQLR